MPSEPEKGRYATYCKNGSCPCHTRTTAPDAREEAFYREVRFSEPYTHRKEEIWKKYAVPAIAQARADTLAEVLAAIPNDLSLAVFSPGRLREKEMYNKGLEAARTAISRLVDREENHG